MTTIPFALPTLEEELQELAQAGVTVLVPASGATDSIEVRPASDPADTDAAASWLLRRMAELDAEVSRTSAATAREIELLMARTKRLTDPLVERRAKLEQMVLELASQADFGKKKSREVGSGTYGRKQVPEKLEVQDTEAATTWARTELPSALRTTIKTEYAVWDSLLAQYPHLAERATVALALDAKRLLEALHSSGELPPGCELIPAHDKPYCKLALPAAGEEA